MYDTDASYICYNLALAGFLQVWLVSDIAYGIKYYAAAIMNSWVPNFAQNACK
mgnify:CR=1 FL=1